jgi:hypothetical protein
VSNVAATVVTTLRRRWLVVAIAAAAVAGLVGGWILHDVTAPPQSSLAIFDSPARPQDSHPPALIFGQSGITDARLLARFDGVAVWGAIASTPNENGRPTSLVCLGFFEEVDGGGASCVTRAEFMTDGIRRGLYTWGPTGDVSLIQY